MWIVKGTFLGIWLFSFGTIGYLYLRVYRGLPSGAGAVSANLITHLTIHNVVWWFGLLLCFIVGLFITRSWPGKPMLWIALVLTEVFPVALFTIFVVILERLKEAAGK